MSLKCYTVNTDGIDAPRSDVPVFTDNLGWTNRQASKFYKTCPHLWLPNEPTIYTDANIFLLDSGPLEASLEHSDLVVFRHPYRQTIEQECHDVALRLNTDTTDLKKAYGPRLSSPGLYEAGVLARNCTQAVRQLGEIWWALICRYSLRDQLTLPLALEQLPTLRVFVIEANLREVPWLRFVPH